MEHRNVEKCNSASGQVMTEWRGRAIGTAGAISAFLTFGLGPLAQVPEAHADGFDAVIDQALDAITGSAGELSDVSATVPEAGVADASWVHALEQDWSGTALAQQLDTALETLFNHVAPAVEGNAGGSALSTSQNLLVNPDFETADPDGSGYNGVTIPGWTETGTPTVMEYGTLRNYPSFLSQPFPDLPAFLGFPQQAPPDTPAGDDNFAGGGPVATSSISQTVNLTGAAGTPFELSADLGGQDLNPSYTTVQVSFLNADGDVLGTDSLDPVTVWDRLGITGFEHRDIDGTVPEGTTSAQVTTTFHDENPFLGNYNGAYAANESFTVGDPSLTPAPLTPPASDVEHLDHVFVIYLENQGNGAVLDNPSAPFLNSLIKSEDFDSGYHAEGHPSNPNYIELMGGSAFGLDYDAGGGVVNGSNLMQEMDQAGVSWAVYDEGIPSGTTDITPQDAAGATPFGEFSYVFDNTPAYLQDHIFPQSDLSSALQNPSTFPDFTWVKPNGIGPSTDLDTVLGFIGGDLLNLPYNLQNEDQYVEQTVDTIENSPTWTDPNEKDAIFITFDEDNNEPALGFENEGNNVPLIVIPNQGAVTEGGMQAGPYTTDTYSNVYDLMSTIEDALRPAPGTLDPLTDNDKYASPLNIFWKDSGTTEA